MSQIEHYNRGGISRWYWDFRDRAVFSMIGQGPILDAGCGDGVTTSKIDAIGMDLDRGAVRGSVFDIPFKKESFGTVLFLEVLEHLRNPRAAFAEIRRVLKPGGRIIVMFPNDLIFKLAWLLFFRWRDAFRDWGHLKQWHPDTAAYLLERSGFKITESRSIPFRFWPLSLHHIIVGEKC